MNALAAPSQRALDLNVEIKRLNRLRLRGTVAASPLFVLVALFTGREAAAPVPLVQPLGGLVILAAVGLRLWALGCIDGHEKRVLVTWGPYRYLRPRPYASSMLFALGACLVAGSVAAALVLLLVFLGFYLPVLQAEEQFLAARFGAEWDAYRRQTR